MCLSQRRIVRGPARSRRCLLAFHIYGLNRINLKLMLMESIRLAYWGGHGLRAKSRVLGLLFSLWLIHSDSWYVHSVPGRDEWKTTADGSSDKSSLKLQERQDPPPVEARGIRQHPPAGGDTPDFSPLGRNTEGEFVTKKHYQVGPLS